MPPFVAKPTPVDTFNTLCGYVARTCYVAAYLELADYITPSQAASVVSSWNSNFNVGAPVLTLADCAKQTAGVLSDWWNTPPLLNQLGTRCDGFAQDVLNLFPDSAPNSRPVADWAVLILATI